MDVERLLSWYRANKRAMPWRDNPDPYAVWVSEIMLQQTRIETVYGYFARFMARFPTFRALASAPMQDVLKAWEGLGYYTRARNLKRAAESIRSLPGTLEGWRALPGVGPYTAAAIASVCLGVAAPVVDGNVSRVLARLRRFAGDTRSAPARERLAAWLQPFIDCAEQPGEFNQAMMELGETVCLPRSPACSRCPFAGTCLAHAAGEEEKFPERKAKKTIPERHSLAFRHSDGEGRFLFAQRPPDGLLGGLWELPNQEAKRKTTTKAARPVFHSRTGLVPSAVRYAGTVTHVFSHFKLQFHVYDVEASGEPKNGCVFALPETLPLATATRKALRL